MTYRIKTDVILSFLDSEREFTLEVEYYFIGGYDATLDEPGEPDGVGIVSVWICDNANKASRRHPADWLIQYIEDQESLQAECLADYRDREEYAREQRADEIREERLLERGR